MSAVLQYYYNAITITNAEKDDEGNYTCAVRVPSKNTPPKTVKKKFLGKYNLHANKEGIKEVRSESCAVHCLQLLL